MKSFLSSVWANNNIKVLISKIFYVVNLCEHKFTKVCNKEAIITLMRYLLLVLKKCEDI